MTRTPAPWRRNAKTGNVEARLHGAGPYVVATLPARYDAKLRDHREGNGRLIEAAPELLEACRIVEILVDECREGRAHGPRLAQALMDLSHNHIRPALGIADGHEAWKQRQPAKRTERCKRSN